MEIEIRRPRPAPARRTRRFRTLVGLRLPTGRVEAGKTTEEIPAESRRWLLAGGYVEEVTDGGESRD